MRIKVKSNASLGGCLLTMMFAVIGVTLAAFIGEWAIGSVLADAFGPDAYNRWEALPVYVRYPVGAIASEVALPVALVVWLLTLGLSVPLF